MQNILISGREGIYDLELKYILQEYKLTFTKLKNIINLLDKNHFDLLLLHDYHTDKEFDEIDLIRLKFTNPIIFISTYYKNKEIKFADVIIDAPYDRGTLLGSIQDLLANNNLVT